MKLLALTAGLTAALLLTGCGGSDRRAAVSGKVTVGGKSPLTGGNIRFVSVADPNKIGNGQIKPDGTYEVPDAPLGECKVVIDNTHLDTSTKKGTMPMVPSVPGGPGKKGPSLTPSGPTAGDKAKMSGPPKGADVPDEMGDSKTATGQKYVKIDIGYSKPDTTTLKATISGGSNTGLDFDVK